MATKKNNKTTTNLGDFEKADLIYDKDATKTAFFVGLLVNLSICLLCLINVISVFGLLVYFLTHLNDYTHEMRVFIASFNAFIIYVITIVTIITRSRNHEKQYPVYKIFGIIFAILTLSTGANASMIGKEIYKKIPEIRTSI